MTDDDIDWRRIAEAYLHPAVLLILDELRVHEQSPSGIYRRVGADAGLTLPALSYHVRAMASRELIVLSRAIPRRGSMEHVYRIAAVR